MRIKRRLKEIEAQKNTAWKKYEEDYQQIENQRDQLFEEVESLLDRSREEEILFTIRWNLIQE